MVASLNEQLQNGQVIGGGIYDCLSAAIAVDAGFGALALSGAGVAASAAGVPDLGLLSFGELIGTARAITTRSKIPVIIDADTGFGNELNTARTCEELAVAGASAIMIEDQTYPKRCGHLAGKEVVSQSEFTSKLRAARDALAGSDVLLVARTDALAVHGLDASIGRCRAALDAGADVTFVEAPEDLATIDAIASRVPGHKMFNSATGGRSPSLAFADLADRGFNVVVIPGLALMPAIRAMRDAAAAVLSAGTDAPLADYGIAPRDIFESVGLSQWLERESRYATHNGLD